MLFSFFTNYKKEFISITISIFGILLGFSLDIIIARLLNINEFGIYKYFYSFVILFSVLLSFGSSQLLIKSFAEKKSLIQKIEDLINQSILSLLLIIIFLFFFLFLINYFLPLEIKKIFIFLILYLFGFFKNNFYKCKSGNNWNWKLYTRTNFRSVFAKFVTDFSSVF